jgi:hypothetical protein
MKQGIEEFCRTETTLKAIIDIIGFTTVHENASIVRNTMIELRPLQALNSSRGFLLPIAV